MVDLDGRFEYSDVRDVVFDNKVKATKLEVFPNL